MGTGNDGSLKLLISFPGMVFPSPFFYIFEVIFFEIHGDVIFFFLSMRSYVCFHWLDASERERRETKGGFGDDCK